MRVASLLRQEVARVCRLPLLLTILAIAGCHPSAADKPAGSQGTQPAETTDESNGEPSAREGQYVDFAQRIESLVAAGEADEVGKLIDWDRFCDRTFTGINASQQEKDIYRKVWSKSNVFAAWICDNVAEGGSYHFLRIKSHGQSRRAVFRLRQRSAGMNYHEILLAAGSNGELRVNDVDTYVNGQLLSATMRWTMLRQMIATKPEWQGSLRGKEKALIPCADKADKMQQEFEAQHYPSALALYAALPPQVQHALPVLLLRMQAASQVGQAESAAAFDELRKFYGKNPAVDMVSIDFYFTNKRFDEERAALSRLDRRVGGDAHLQVLAATSFAAEDNLEEAAKCADRAIAEEPGLEDAYWTRITIALRGKDNVTVVNLLNALETELNIEIADPTSVPAYAEFVKSDEFKQWKADHSGEGDAPAVSQEE